MASCCIFAVEAASPEADTITDIQEKASFEKGAYTTDTEGNTTAVKKDAGFDFKVPEIRISGQVDTKIMLKREINSLEDLQSVKNILYEKEKVYMPDYYLKEETLSPGALNLSADRDFIGQLTLAVGSYTNILLNGIVGKVFDKDNKAILGINHDNYSKDNINNKAIYDNLNSCDFLYATKYDFIDAVYRFDADISTYGNPYSDTPLNIFNKEMDTTDISFMASFSGKAAEYGFSGNVGYTYFNSQNDLKQKIYKENRTMISASLDRNFDIENETKVKLVSSLDFWTAEQLMEGTVYQGIINTDLLIKGILYFEPLVVQAGIRIVDYKLTDNDFYLGLYANANYDILPNVSIYAAMDPTMRAPDYIITLPGKFISPNASLKPSSDLLNIKTGINWNLESIFLNTYWGYKIEKNALMNNEVLNTKYYTLVNNDLEYDYAGLSIETQKIENFSFVAAYEYKNIINKGTYKQAYLPSNEFSLKTAYELNEWKFNLTMKMMSGYMGTQTEKAGAYADIDASISNKINEMLTITGYINNLLNNNYYLLYYYKEKNINFGFDITLNF